MIRRRCRRYLLEQLNDAFELLNVAGAPSRVPQIINFRFKLGVLVGRVTADVDDERVLQIRLVGPQQLEQVGRLYPVALSLRALAVLGPQPKQLRERLKAAGIQLRIRDGLCCQPPGRSICLLAQERPGVARRLVLR
jgi:hypothetical protein